MEYSSTKMMTVSREESLNLVTTLILKKVSFKRLTLFSRVDKKLCYKTVPNNRNYSTVRNRSILMMINYLYSYYELAK